MNLSYQMILANVTDLERSAGFYSEVLEFRIASRDNEVVTLMVNRDDRHQVLILRRAYGNSHPGRKTVGPSLIAYEAASIEEVNLIETRLKERKAFVGRRRSDGWEAVMGLDPDRIPVSIAANPAGGSISVEDWSSIDPSLYVVGG
jgi:catechol-2,3-dioxygenase